MKTNAVVALAALLVLPSAAEAEEPPANEPEPASVPVSALSSQTAPEADPAADEESEEEEDGAGFAMGFEADTQLVYAWRGQQSSAGPVDQPFFFLDLYNFEFSVYGNIPLNNQETDVNGAAIRPGTLTEFGPQLTYFGAFGDLRIEPSVVFYFYPGLKDAPTGEAWLKLAYPVLSSLPDLSLYALNIVDFVGAKGGYYGEAGLEFEREVLNGNGVLFSNLGLSAGTARFNSFYFDVDRAALEAVSASVFLEYTFLKHLYARPHIEASFLLDNELAGNIQDSPFLFNAGLAIGAAL
jgi:hypothetical protein